MNWGPKHVTKVMDGEAEVSQVAVFALKEQSSLVDLLSMPYLFNSHDHVKKVISGPIGQEIMDDILLGSKQSIKGIAFTYSGGYRVISGSKKFLTANDFIEAKAADSGIGGPRREFFKKLGVKFVEGDIFSRDDFVEAHVKKLIDFEDSELNRIYTLSKDHPELLNSLKYVTETNHSYYLTLIIINNKFLQSLPPALQKILIDEVKVFAEKERVLSIKQAEESKKYLMSKGVNFYKLDKKSMDKMKKIGKEVQENNKLNLRGLLERTLAL